MRCGGSAFWWTTTILPGARQQTGYEAYDIFIRYSYVDTIDHVAGQQDPRFERSKREIC